MIYPGQLLVVTCYGTDWLEVPRQKWSGVVVRVVSHDTANQLYAIRALPAHQPMASEYTYALSFKYEWLTMDLSMFREQT